MNETIPALSALLLTCATLSAVMVIAWRSLGRPRHALVWACAFGTATLQWGVNIAYLLVAPVPAMLSGVHMLAICVSVLIAVGFRERAGRSPRTALWLGGLLLGILGIAGALLAGSVALSVGVVNLTRALVLCVAAAALGPDRRAPRPAERSAAVVLVLFAAVSLVAATLSLAGLFVRAPTPAIAHSILVMTLPSALTAVGLVSVLLLASDLAERLHELAARDPLTDVLNRRGFREAALRALARAQRGGRPAAVVLADIDRFKAINDTQGHAAGDLVLVRVARYLEGAIRVGDLFGRIGGEEFAILLEGVEEPAAAEVIERIRAGIEGLDLGLQRPVALTISFGIAGLPADGAVELDQLIDAADRALYASKLGGRNRVTCAGLSATVAAGAAAAEPVRVSAE